MLIWPSWQRPSDPLDPAQICLTGAQSKTPILTFSRLLGPDPHRKSAPIFFWVNIFCSGFFCCRTTDLKRPKMRSCISNFIWEILEYQKPVRVDFSTFLHLFCDSIHTIMILISNFSKNIDFQKIKFKTKILPSLKTPNLPGYILTPSELWERPSEAVHPNSLQGVVLAFFGQTIYLLFEHYLTY